MTASTVRLAAPGSASPKPAPSGRRRRRRAAVVPANAGDHPGIHHFLTAVFQGPSRGEFRASLEDPFYEPKDRLLVNRGSQIVAHVHVVHRVMQFGPVQLPVAWLDWLGTLPAYRGQGHGHRLVTAAEQQMASQGALIGLMWTPIPRFFRHTGWAVCGRRCHGQASSRDLLSELMARRLLRRRRTRLNIRPWRRMELGALMRIYKEGFSGMFGPLLRTEAYWKWLIQRHGYDQICVALDGPDLLELEETHAPIVGYAVLRGERIVELLAAPSHPVVPAELLARACRDGIERGRHTVGLEAPPNSRVDKLFRHLAGNHHHQHVDQGKVLMARLLDPGKLLRALAGELHRRAEAAGLPRPVELGLLVDGKKHRLTITADGVDVTAGSIGRSYLRLQVADFTRLLLGRLDWDRALADGRIRASTGIAQNAGPALFPRLPLWCPPLDHLPARK